MNMDIKEVRISKNNTKTYKFVKRAIDILISATALIITAPVVLVVCILVRIESKGKAIYKQKRVGLNNKEFYCYKIRSMKDDAEVNGPQWADRDDPRVTKIGRFIRRTRIDEIPQFYNIFLGDMTFIGPRPEREIFYEKFEKEVSNFRERLLVKPGLTGYAQVNGGYELKPAEKLKLDLYYIENQCFKLDISIVLKTFRVVVTGEGAR